MPGEEEVGINLFVFRLPPYKSGSHGTLLKGLCQPAHLEGIPHLILPVLALKQQREKERNELVVSLTWHVCETTHVHPPALSPLTSSTL